MRESDPAIHAAQSVRRVFLCAVALAAALVGYGVLRIPTVLTASKTGYQSVIGVALMLAVYAGVGFMRIPRLAARDAYAFRITWVAGCLASAIFAIEIVLEYILLPANNMIFGLIEFGLVFFVYFCAATITVARCRTIPGGVRSSVMTSLIAALSWYICVLSIYFLFRGTDRQAQVLLAEGDMEDFQRSGMTDYSAFILEDFFGAGFFHLSLLGPFVAGILGTVGGLVGLGLRRFAAPKPGPGDTKS